MGLLDDIGSASSKLNNTLGGASAKLDSLTSAAKGVLCLPTMVSGLVSSLPNIAGGLVGSIVNTINGTINAATSIAVGAIDQAVDNVTGIINDTAATVNALLISISDAVNQITGFADNIKSRVGDVKSFISDKENCNFAGAALGKCIAQESISSTTRKDIRSVAGGAISSSSLVNDTVSKVGRLEGTINNVVNKHAAQVTRATSVIQKAGKYI